MTRILSFNVYVQIAGLRLFISTCVLLDECYFSLDLLYYVCVVLIITQLESHRCQTLFVQASGTYVVSARAYLFMYLVSSYFGIHNLAS